MKRIGLIVLAVAVGCASPTGSKQASPSRCPSATTTASDAEARDKLDGHVPEWLPAGFYLAAVEEGDGQIHRGVSAIWSNAECHRVTVGLVSSSEQVAGQWTELGENPCREQSPKPSQCFLYRTGIKRWEKTDSLHPYAFVDVYGSDVTREEMERVVHSVSV